MLLGVNYEAIEHQREEKMLFVYWFVAVSLYKKHNAIFFVFVVSFVVSIVII